MVTLGGRRPRQREERIRRPSSLPRQGRTLMPIRSIMSGSAAYRLCSGTSSIAGSRELELPGNRRNGSRRTRGGLLGLPDVAHLEPSRSGPPRGAHCRLRGSSRAPEPRHGGGVLIGCDPRPAHEHRDSHPSPRYGRVSGMRAQPTRGCGEKRRIEALRSLDRVILQGKRCCPRVTLPHRRPRHDGCWPLPAKPASGRDRTRHG